MPFVCPGRCNAIYRTARRDNPENADQYAVWGEPVWCANCGQIIRSALRSFPNAYRALDAVPYMTPRAPSDELMTHVSGSHSRPSPGPGVDLRDDMSRTICSWEDDLRQYLRIQSAHLPPGGYDAMANAVDTINQHFDKMIGRAECAEDFGTEVLMLFMAALTMVKNHPIRRLLRMPCPRCDMRTLVQQEGLPGRPWYTECAERMGGCGSLFNEQEMSWAAEVRVVLAR